MRTFPFAFPGTFTHPASAPLPGSRKRLFGEIARVTRGTAAAWFVLLALTATSCPAATDEAARADFLAAERALEAGDLARFQALRANLRDYPLRPYLDVAAMRARLDQADPAEVRALLDELADVPIASDLRRHWLASLARRGEWALVRTAWRPGLGATAECLHARALFATGATAEAVQAARALWLHGASRPAQCDAVFEDLAGSGNLTADLVWQRFELAMEAGQDGLARHLLARLDPAQRSTAQTWLTLRGNPAALDAPDALAGTGPYAAGILTDVLRRQARADPLAAASRWERWRDALPLSATQAGQIDRALAVMLAVDREPLAGRYFDLLPAQAYDDTTYEWRARHALGQGDWQGLADAIGAMPAPLAAKARWQYWRGRALEELGDAGADAAYRAAAGEREFHGFLAAEKLGRPPALNPRATPEDPAVQARLAALPGVARARELDALGRRLPARREWNHAMRNQDPGALAQATLLAHRWGWRADAITLAARTGLWDDLEVRFPVVFEGEVTRAARTSGLDPALIAAVMRRESALNPYARSHADARGLMQLLPATARRVARQMGEPWNVAGLYDPATNIRYGSQYLADQLVRFGGHRALAAAAYNAGPHRVVRWLGPRPQPADVWIELIPFGETREYVSAVLAYAVIYATRAGLAPPPLSAWLAPVPAAETLARCGPDSTC